MIRTILTGTVHPNRCWPWNCQASHLINIQEPIWFSQGDAFIMHSTMVLPVFILFHKWSRIGPCKRLLESNSWEQWTLKEFWEPMNVVYFLWSCLYWFVLYNLLVLLCQIYPLVWFFSLLPSWAQFFGYILLDFLCSLSYTSEICYSGIWIIWKP